MLKTLTLSAAVCLSIGGCAVARPTYDASGKKVLAISCPGAPNNWSTCYEKARTLCGAAGYEVLMQNGQATPYGLANGYADGTAIPVTPAVALNGAMVSRNLLAQCKGQ